MMWGREGYRYFPQPTGKLSEVYSTRGFKHMMRTIWESVCMILCIAQTEEPSNFGYQRLWSCLGDVCGVGDTPYQKRCSMPCNRGLSATALLMIARDNNSWSCLNSCALRISSSTLRRRKQLPERKGTRHRE